MIDEEPPSAVRIVDDIDSVDLTSEEEEQINTNRNLISKNEVREQNGFDIY